MAADWASERIFVTGATGMVGANLVRRLIALGNRPSLLTRAASHRERLESVSDGLVWCTGDMTDAASLGACVAAVKPTIVFHLASSFFNPPTLSAAEHMAANAGGMLNLCEALKEIESVRLITAGSCSVYAGGERLAETAELDPGSMFGVSKATATMISRNFSRQRGLSMVELRLFTPFGPWESARRIIPDTILSALAGRDVRIGHGGQKRDFVYMDDVIDAFIAAATAPSLPDFQVINIGSGVGRPIRDVVANILELMGNPVRFVTGAFATRPDEIWEISADIASAERTLGWRPKIGFSEGLRKSIDWVREHQALAARLN